MTQNEAYLHPSQRFPWPGLLAPAIFALLTCLMFNDFLFDASKVIADKNTDLAPYFLPARKFGFDEIRHGNLPLWNPHNYGGAPFLAGFQSALLYPPNWLHLVMPVGLAMNWISAVHVFAAGMFMYAWCRYRKLSRGSSILAGTMFMFSGPYIPHVYAGHPPHVAIIPWAPLLFLTIDLLMDGRFVRGVALGIFALAMFLLAGHPQYVYYTAMAAGVYVLVNLVRLPIQTDVAWRHRARVTVAGMAVAVGGAGLAAIQLLPGVDFVSESVRSGGAKYELSATFSFPPENLLTVFSPNVFGTLPAREDVGPPDAYFGRCYIWEVCLFVSTTGLMLAIYGALASPARFRRWAVTMVVVCFIFALGAHTPLHRFLYDHLPGFASFRGSVKFNYLVAMFVALLAAYGFDALLRARRPWAFLTVAASTFAFVLIFAIVIRSSALDSGKDGVWGHALRDAVESAGNADEYFLNTRFMADPEFYKAAGLVVSGALFSATVVIGAALLVTGIAWIKPDFRYLLIALVLVEMVWYAASTRGTLGGRKPTKDESQWLSFDMELPPGWLPTIRSLPADARVMSVNLHYSSSGMWFGYDDMWGYDPAVLKRYAELLTRSQGGNVKNVSQNVEFRRGDPHVFPLCRLSTVFQPGADKPIVPMQGAMPLVTLISSANVIPDRDKLLNFIESQSFDPHNCVVLESEPAIKPVDALSPGEVRVIGKSTDSIDLDVDVSSNAILLITNAYSRGWRAEAREPGPQAKYELMPANWAFQAVPLLTGRHHLRLEYRPTAFVVGRWISIIAILGYLCALWRFRAQIIRYD